MYVCFLGEGVKLEGRWLVIIIFFTCINMVVLGV